MTTVILGILLQVAAVSCLSFCPAMPNDETLRNVAVTDNNIIVGSSSTLYRLAPDLVEVETMILPPMSLPNRLLVADTTRNGMFGGAVLACGSPHCILSRNTRLSDIVWQGPVLDPGEMNVLAALSLTSDGTLSVTYGTRQNQARPSTITRGSLLNSFRSPPYMFMLDAEQREPTTLVSREFLTVFSNEGYQYFIVSIDNEVHVTRLCLSDNGDQSSTSMPSPFASHFELELKCATSELATAATFVNSTEPFGVETVLLTFQVISSDTFHICAFNLSEINVRMDQKFEACVNGSGMSGFSRDRQVPCPTLQPQQIDSMDISTCNLGPLLPGLEVDNSLDELFPLLSLEAPAGVSSMAYTEYLTSGSHYLFLGTRVGRLFQVLLVNSTYAELVRDMQIVRNNMDQTDDITQLVPSNGGDYIYAITAQQLIRECVDPDETISLNNCETPTPTPVESPLPTDPVASDNNVVVIASSVTAGVVVGGLGVLAVVFAVVALIKTHKAHKRTRLSAYHSQEELHELKDDHRNNALAERMRVGTVYLTESARKLPQELVIPNDQIRLMDSIGQGEFGIVYKAHLTRLHGPPRVAAVKTLKGLFTVNDVHSMTDEILKMNHFDHPNVMTLIGVCVSVGGGPAIVMPFMENGSLLNYLRKDKKNITVNDDQDLETLGAVQKLLLNLCLQVAKGMEYLALQKFVHRDLAARNCMIDGSGVIKVADFGLAEDMYSSEYFRQDKSGSSVKLPFKWMPLESLQEGLFSQKSDVWSFGVTCWEVFTAGKIPYAGVDPLMLIELLENGRRLDKPSNAACSDEIYSMMQSCWESEPENRPQFCELVSTISSILESAAGYLELAMSLRDDKPEIQGSEPRGDDGDKPGNDA